MAAHDVIYGTSAGGSDCALTSVCRHTGAVETKQVSGLPFDT